MFMGDVFRPLFGRSQSFAQIMQQCRESDQCIARRQTRGHVTDHFHVPAGIDFRVVFRALRNAVKHVHFRQHHGQCATGAQGLQKSGGRSARQCSADFLPNPLRHQMIDFAGRHHIPHQCQRFRRQ